MSSDASTTAEIVAVGHELLTGRTADTNSAWIAARLTDSGFAVGRIVVVEDEPAEVAHEIGTACARDAALVVTTGGLGPTLDDRTLAGVAAALGRSLVEHAGALAFVTRRYAELAAAGAVGDATITPPRRKMALLPAGAEPVDNPVGSAPGVLVRDGGFALLAVPGVPAEMRAVVECALPALLPLLARPVRLAERYVATGSGDESVITVATERVMRALPGVHLKSLPTEFGSGVDLQVRITARAAGADDAEALVERAAARLTAELAALG
jgi:molybdenum cofactor synthesis domain-containing protein